MYLRQNTNQYTSDVLHAIGGLFLVCILALMIKNTDVYDSNTLGRLLMEQSRKWYEMSMQDKEKSYAQQHCNYATAYLNAARQTADDKILEQVSKINVYDLSKKLEDREKKLTTKKNKKIRPSWIL